jgi:clan AA aspartic protease
VAAGEAVIEIEVSSSPPTTMPVVIDTGFNGELTLSRHLVNSLAPQFAGRRRLALADGQIVTLDVYLVTITWHGRPRDVLAAQTGDETLVGMALLEGSRVTIEAWDGGNVTIDKVK